MRIWSRGLGKRELLMDLSKCEITREGDRYILTGTVVSPVNWEFRITMEPQDVPGLMRTAMSSGFIVLGLKWLGRLLKAPFASLGEGPCWEKNPGCGTGRIADCEPCPAFTAKTTCWSFEWSSVGDGPTRAKFREILATRCAQCALFPAHREALERAQAAFLA